MPKLRSKEKALEIIASLGRSLLRLCEERGVVELTVGRGELRGMLNPNTRRGKDLLTMSLRRFTVDGVIITPSWEMVVRDWEKPVIYFRKKVVESG